MRTATTQTRQTKKVRALGVSELVASPKPPKMHDFSVRGSNNDLRNDTVEFREGMVKQVIEAAARRASSLSQEVGP